MSKLHYFKYADGFISGAYGETPEAAHADVQIARPGEIVEFAIPEKPADVKMWQAWPPAPVAPEPTPVDPPAPVDPPPGDPDA